MIIINGMCPLPDLVKPVVARVLEEAADLPGVLTLCGIHLTKHAYDDAENDKTSARVMNCVYQRDSIGLLLNSQEQLEQSCLKLHSNVRSPLLPVSRPQSARRVRVRVRVRVWVWVHV